MTLLEQARAVEVNRRSRLRDVTPGEVEVAVAFLRGEIRPSQVAAVFRLRESAVYTRVISILRCAVDRGMLSLEVKRAP